MFLDRIPRIPIWARSGIASLIAMFASLCSLRIFCGPDGRVCDRLWSVYILLHRPFWVVASPVLHFAERILGYRGARGDMIIVFDAPPGVVQLLDILRWLLFCIYWFALGVAVWLAYRVIRALLLRQRAASP